MRERRYVKFKVDIYDDTKTKIIDQRPERDFIHYFFARSIILAGKSDCEGKLYMAKDIPYNIETLAIEFGRDTALVKLALDVLIELKMIEVTEDNIYRVKSFVKHQNIKAKEEDKTNGKEEAGISENNKGREIKEDKQVEDSRRKKINKQEDCGDKNNQVQEENEKPEFEPKNYKPSNKIGKKESGNDERIEDFENVRENQEESTEIILGNKNQHVIPDYIRNTAIAGVAMEEEMTNTKQYVEADSINIAGEENIYVNSELGMASNGLGNNDNQENTQFNSQQDNLVVLEMKDNKKTKKKKKSESDLVTELAADEMEDDSPILVFSEGDMPPLGEGERLVWGLTPV